MHPRLPVQYKPEYREECTGYKPETAQTTAVNTVVLNTHQRELNTTNNTATLTVLLTSYRWGGQPHTELIYTTFRLAVPAAGAGAEEAAGSRAG